MTEAKPLTPRQAEILAFIGSSTAEHGTPPTLREIARHFGIGSTNAVNDHLLALERKGWIVKGGHQKSRTLRVVGAPPTPTLTAWDAMSPEARTKAISFLRAAVRGRPDRWVVPTGVLDAAFEKLGAP